MKLTQYLTLHEVLELHKKTIEKHGGSMGVRDLGLVESALYRPQSGYYETISAQAASLLQSFCMNHPFVDGNKRVSLLVCVVFLKMNGFNLKVKNPTLVNFILNEVIQKRADAEAISLWLEGKMVKRG